MIKVLIKSDKDGHITTSLGNIRCQFRSDILCFLSLMLETVFCVSCTFLVSISEKGTTKMVKSWYPDPIYFCKLEFYVLHSFSSNMFFSAVMKRIVTLRLNRRWYFFYMKSQVILKHTVHFADNFLWI